MADLNFLNITDCEDIRFNTPTTDLQYIEYSIGSVVKDFTNVDKYTITHSTNCCDNGTVTEIAPRYQLVPSIESCLDPTYTIKVEGINGNLVQDVQVSTDGGTVFIPFGFTVVSDELILEPSSGVAVVNFIFRITTISGFIYDLYLTLTQTPTSCDGVLSNISVVYPTLPSNIIQVSDTAVAAGTGDVTGLPGTWTFISGAPLSIELTADNPGIIGNSIIIGPGDNVTTLATLLATWNAANPTNTATLIETNGTGYVPRGGDTFVLTGGLAEISPIELSFNSLIGTTPTSGVHQLLFCEVNQDTTSTCVGNNVFIDCGATCAVIDVTANNLCTKLYLFLDALKYANDCSTITYQQKCDMWYIIGKELGYFTSTPCATSSDCGCS